MGERRKSERHRVRFHLVFDDGASFNAGTVHDVSEGGLFLETGIPLASGTEVRLTPLDSAGNSLFEVRARVIRSVPYTAETSGAGMSGMGLEFLDLSAEERKSVVTMIRDLEARASGRGSVDPYLGVVVPGVESDSVEKG